MKRAKPANGRSATKPGGAPKNIDEYLAGVPEPARSTLNKIRAAIWSAVPPEASETISYRIPAFKYKGILLWFAAFPDHCSLFPTASIIEASPAEAIAWIRAKEDVSAEDRTRFVQNGTQSIFENDVHWARFYLVKAGLLGNARRGLWSLTTEGREKRLSQEETWDLYVRIRDANRPSGSQAEEDVPAPGTEGDITGEDRK